MPWTKLNLFTMYVAKSCPFCCLCEEEQHKLHQPQSSFASTPQLHYWSCQSYLFLPCFAVIDDALLVCLSTWMTRTCFLITCSPVWSQASCHCKNAMLHPQHATLGALNCFILVRKLRLGCVHSIRLRTAFVHAFAPWAYSYGMTVLALFMPLKV